MGLAEEVEHAGLLQTELDARVHDLSDAHLAGGGGDTGERGWVTGVST